MHICAEDTTLSIHYVITFLARNVRDACASSTQLDSCNNTFIVQLLAEHIFFIIAFMDLYFLALAPLKMNRGSETSMDVCRLCRHKVRFAFHRGAAT